MLDVRLVRPGIRPVAIWLVHDGTEDRIVVEPFSAHRLLDGQRFRIDWSNIVSMSCERVPLSLGTRIFELALRDDTQLAFVVRQGGKEVARFIENRRMEMGSASATP